MSDRDEDHVGYGRPPKWGQFQKGKSGNPKGRPRKKRKEASPPTDSELDELLNEVFDQKVTIKEDGQTKEITMKAAIAKRLAADAVKGNHHAQREALRLARAVEENEAKRAAATKQNEAEESEKEEKERQQMFNYLRDLKGSQSAKWKEAQEAGLEEPTQPWPHPDDIILNEAGDAFWVRGPLSEETVPAWEDACRTRDLFLIELVLAITEDAEQLTERLWLALVANEDLRLPKRWQITHDLGPAMAPLASMRLLQLRQLAEQERAWLKAKAPDTPLTKAQYRDANRIFGPMVKALGYKSLKHFERALEM